MQTSGYKLMLTGNFDYMMNADETPIQFNMSYNTTLASIGSNEVLIIRNSDEKKRITASEAAQTNGPANCEMRANVDIQKERHGELSRLRVRLRFRLIITQLQEMRDYNLMSFMPIVSSSFEAKQVSKCDTVWKFCKLPKLTTKGFDFTSLYTNLKHDTIMKNIAYVDWCKLNASSWPGNGRW